LRTTQTNDGCEEQPRLEDLPGFHHPDYPELRELARAGGTLVQTKGKWPDGPWEDRVLRAWSLAVCLSYPRLYPDFGVALWPRLIWDGYRFAALDVDPRHGGDESFAALVRKCGPLPLTPADRR